MSDENPPMARRWKDRAGAHYSNFVKDALRKNLGRRTVNIPQDETICDVFVEKEGIDYTGILVNLNLPAVFGVMGWFLYSLLANKGTITWPPWWVWLLCVVAIIVPQLIRPRLKDRILFHFKVITDKAIYAFTVDRLQGWDLAVPISSLKFADVKLLGWWRLTASGLKKGRGQLRLYTDLEESYDFEFPSHAPHVQRILASLILQPCPPAVFLPEFDKIAHISQVDRANASFTPDPACVARVHEKRCKTAIGCPLIIILIALAMWGIIAAWPNLWWIVLLFGGCCLLFPVAAIADTFLTTRAYTNAGGESIRITDHSIEVLSPGKPPEVFEFAPDWMLSLVNALVTLSNSNRFNIYDTLEVRKVSPSFGKQPLIKVGFLPMTEFVHCYLELQDAYLKWLEQYHPSYFQTPAQIQQEFIAEHPFHRELVNLLELQRQKFGEEKARAKQTFQKQAFPALEAIPHTSPGELRYPLLTYTKYFADDEQLIYGYHAERPIRVFTEAKRLVSLALFVASLIICVMIYDPRSWEYIMPLISAIIFGGFFVMYLLGAIFQYWEQHSLELVLTTRNLYLLSGGEVHVMPYVNLAEVHCIGLNPQTGEYKQVQFARTLPVPSSSAFSVEFLRVSRASPLFAVLNHYGVPLLEHD